MALADDVHAGIRIRARRALAHRDRRTTASGAAGRGLLTAPVRVVPAFSNRPHLLLRPKSPLVCPLAIAGVRHLLKTNAILKPLGLLRCTHRPSANQGECGARVVVLAMADGWQYLAQVSPQEAREVEAMSSEQLLAYVLTGSVRTTSMPPAGTSPAPDSAREVPSSSQP